MVSGSSADPPLSPASRLAASVSSSFWHGDADGAEDGDDDDGDVVNGILIGALNVHPR